MIGKTISHYPVFLGIPLKWDEILKKLYGSAIVALQKGKYTKFKYLNLFLLRLVRRKYRPMRYDPKRHHRQSIRLKGYDYSQSGAYFVTICVNKRLCLFGDIENGEMKLNNAGKMVDQIWREIPEYYPGVDIDAHSVMPNHIHGIIILNNDNVGASPCGHPLMNSKHVQAQGQNVQAQGPAPTKTDKRLSLGDVVGRFESFTMHKYIHGVKNDQWEPFYKKLWQRNYYEHIVRNENELNRIRKYIVENPMKWELDRNNPKNWKKET